MNKENGDERRWKVRKDVEEAGSKRDKRSTGETIENIKGSTRQRKYEVKGRVYKYKAIQRRGSKREKQTSKQGRGDTRNTKD